MHRPYGRLSDLYSDIVIFLNVLRYFRFILVGMISLQNHGYHKKSYNFDFFKCICKIGRLVNEFANFATRQMLPSERNQEN